MITQLRRLIVKLSTIWFKITTKGLEVGKKTVIYPSSSISTRYNRSGGIRIGTGCSIGRFSYGYRIGWFYPNRISANGENAIISIGNDCRLNGVNIYARKYVEIGNMAVIASGSQILDSNGHIAACLDRTKARDTPKPVKIGNNVWIGLNSIILKGSVIGDNSIVGAGSVVQGEFPPNSVIKGNPAVVVRTLDL